MADSNQFAGRTAYSLSTSAQRLTLPAAQHSEQRATLVFSEGGAAATLCNAAGTTLLDLPAVAAGSLPLVLTGVRLAAGDLYLRSTAGTPAAVVAVIVEN